MTYSHIWILAFYCSLASVSGTVKLQTDETQKYTCRTFGSGVVVPFNGTGYHLSSNCAATLTRFTHNRVVYDVTTRRGESGLLDRVEITVNKIRTVVQNGDVTVDEKSVSLPYDHTYQHIFHYGTSTRLRSSLLPLTITWHNAPAGIDTVRVELEQALSADMTGLCGKTGLAGNKEQLITESVIPDDTCQTRDPLFALNPLCNLFFSYTLDCLQDRTTQYIRLCEENIYGYESSRSVGCAFFKEVVEQCGNESHIWTIWRTVTGCAAPNCPGDLVYVERGPAFIPTCSNPNPSLSNQDLTSSCVCPEGTVLNDGADGFHCMNISNCPCEFAGRNYMTGDTRGTNCQSCVCESGRWRCSENSCPARCVIEGQFVTTFDGKQYSVPGKCTYVASQGFNWTITVQFSEKHASLKKVVLQLFQDVYTFSLNSIKVGEEEVTELHNSDHALVFWQSSMFAQVETSFGMKIQVQISPEIQLYITTPRNHTYSISGLCGNGNNDTTDDFTTSSGIVENSPQPFALSWSVGTCAANIPTICSSTDSEIFADEKCSVLNDPSGIFARCHGHIATDQFHTDCIQRTCNCGRNLQLCLCVALASYAKACGILGVAVGDWRKATNCTLKCQNNLEFSYDTRACNHTCRSLSGPDPRCGPNDAPVEGCGCPEGTHLNQRQVCIPKAECECHHYEGTTPPGLVSIDGRQCLCENGELQCSKDCGCRNGKVCIHCSECPVNTARKTCDSLRKPRAAGVTCESGCYCAQDHYEDHHGNCVSLDECTCVYSGKVFSAGQHVKTNCKRCTCRQGQWNCEEEPCPGKCQVYGNGHYQTFDSKWYRFNGHCQYTLAEDYCGNKNGSFSISVESVPCCDEALTCSRSIILDLQDTVTLTLSDMRVIRRLKKGWTLQVDSLYSTRTVGLYIIISVPSRGITLIWDKHTRITIELHPNWRNRVCGLCGNFDSNEMNDLQTSGSAVASSPLVFGNSWKAATPPCSDVTAEVFPCERHSYCSAWAQRRCMIITSDIFKDCHLKVDPEPYYHACVQESCTCEFEGKFLGFCTAVAAYAEACSDQDVCVNWRTPDLCPVYCDYYNEQGQCSWHYEACGEMLSCGKVHYFAHKLEGCYPRCPKEAPYYDENTGECTKLKNCTCFFNDTIVQPGTGVIMDFTECLCENGTINCQLTITSTSTATPIPTSIITTPTSGTSTPVTSNTTEQALPPTKPATTQALTTIVSSTVATTTEARSTIPSTYSTPVTIVTDVSTTAPTLSTLPSTTNLPLTTISNGSTTSESWSATHSTTPTPIITTAEGSSASVTWSTASSTTPTPMWTSTTGSSTDETWSTTSLTTPSPMTTIANGQTTYETASPTGSTTPTTMMTTNDGSTVAETRSTTSPTTPTPMTTTAQGSTTSVTWATASSTTPTPMWTSTIGSSTNEIRSTTYDTTTQVPCKECKDLKRKRSWGCNKTWTEDCFSKTCKNGTIELTPVICPDIRIPSCPRQQFTKVSDGCCETWKCDCRCELYGDPHYITFEGVTFDFLDECTYILVEERAPQHYLSIAVDNVFCVPDLRGSCAKGIILRYQNNMATLSINADLFAVEATLNNVTIRPPYQEHGMRFETTGYVVSIYLPQIRSYVSLSPSYTLVVNLAMEHFLNNTQGQCGVCGGSSCIRRGGTIEDNSCCDKTAYEWVLSDPLNPACVSAPRNASCHYGPGPAPSSTPFTTTTCPEGSLCALLDHPVFSNCSLSVNLHLKKKNCEFDSCGNRGGPCSALEQAAEECKNAGFCVDWRDLTDGLCDVACPKGLVYRECRDKLDDFCYGGMQFPGSALDKSSSGCFCPIGQNRAGSHSDICVFNCSYCKGAHGEPRLPGEIWQSNCFLCTCNNQTWTEQCVPKPTEPPPRCGPNAILAKASCCGDQVCVEKICSYNKKTYKVGDTWKDAAHPCTSFSCTVDGIRNETIICPQENCPEVDKVWDNQKCCFTCKQTCSPKMSSFNVSTENCTTVIEMPVCQGHCLSLSRVVLMHSYLQVEQRSRCCREQGSEGRSVSLQCSDRTTRHFTYKHVTSCVCRDCSILR